MDTHCNSDKLDFQSCGSRKVTARFDGGHITSDAGVLLLRELERRFGLIERLAECFDDHRDPDYVEHTVEELLRQRIFGLLLGYEAISDHDELRRDSALAVACGKTHPEGSERRQPADEGIPLAGKSTLNRLELGVQGHKEHRYKSIVGDLDQIQSLLIDLWLDHLDGPPKRVLLDLDATDIDLHGDQEDRFYHGYYGDYCYLPLYIFAGDWLLSSWLRFAGQDESAGCLAPLEVMVDRLRDRYPETDVIVRADSGFARERLMRWCRGRDLDYVLGMATNPRLRKRIEEPLEEAQKAFEPESGEPVRRFVDFEYTTLDSWSETRRIVAKVEYLQRGPNPRFVVTSLEDDAWAPRPLYEKLYCGRSEMENRIKECQLDLYADQASTQWRASNQLRVYWSSFAYLFICLLRRHGLAQTPWARAQASTLRTKLFRIGAQIEVTTRRVWFRLASGYPYKPRFRAVVQAIRAGP